MLHSVTFRRCCILACGTVLACNAAALVVGPPAELRPALRLEFQLAPPPAAEPAARAAAAAGWQALQTSPERSLEEAGRVQALQRDLQALHASTRRQAEALAAMRSDADRARGERDAAMALLIALGGLLAAALAWLAWRWHRVGRTAADDGAGSRGALRTVGVEEAIAVHDKTAARQDSRLSVFADSTPSHFGTSQPATHLASRARFAGTTLQPRVVQASQPPAVDLLLQPPASAQVGVDIDVTQPEPEDLPPLDFDISGVAPPPGRGAGA